MQMYKGLNIITNKVGTDHLQSDAILQVIHFDLSVSLHLLKVPRRAIYCLIIIQVAFLIRVR